MKIKNKRKQKETKGNKRKFWQLITMVMAIFILSSCGNDIKKSQNESSDEKEKISNKETSMKNDNNKSQKTHTENVEESNEAAIQETTIQKVADRNSEDTSANVENNNTEIGRENNYQNGDEADEKVKLTYEDAEKIWNNFLSSGSYFDYIEQFQNGPYEYVVADLNADNIPELLLCSTVDKPFYYTWTFVLDNDNVVLVDECYGYGYFEYSPKLNAVICSPETRPLSGTGGYSFYELKGTTLEFMYCVGMDMGESFIYDGETKTIITDEERNSYHEGKVFFDWQKLDE